MVLMGSVPDRTLQAADLYNEGYSDTLLAVHNAFGGRDLLVEKRIDFPTHADLAKMVASELGVNEDDFIIIDGPAYSTRDEAVFIREYFREREDVDSILLVTSKYHSYRSRLIFNKAFDSLDRDIMVISSPSKHDSFNGGVYIQDIEGNYITIPNKSYKQVSFKYIEFINHNNNWQFISHL